MVDMQRRHFEFIAGVLETARHYLEGDDHRAIIAAFSWRLAETNPNFDRERFLAACRGED